MEVRHATNPTDVKGYTTDRLRKDFLVQNLFQEGQVTMVYSHYDRMILGGAIPTGEALKVEDPDTLKTEFFLERREIAFLNVGGGEAVITAGGEQYELGKLDALYVGKGVQDLALASKDAANPARIYLVSTPAHAELPTQKILIDNANPLHLGAIETSNERTIYQYIHADGVKSCQLMLGVTLFKPGSVWNTMPAHLHDRRMEAYLYFDMQPQTRVMHFMGEPSETRHLVVANEEAILSPPWSIHSGAGTSSYSFCWAMAGENYTFKDMDAVPMEALR